MPSVDELLSFIEAMIGPSARKVFKYLMELGEEASDDAIANALEMKINDVRRALYALSEYGLVSYRRVRDKTSGWFIYYWRINVEDINNILLVRKRDILRKLKERLEYEESNSFYYCPVDGTRYTFEEAFENGFTCPRCGAELVYIENDKIKQILMERIRKLEEELERESKIQSS